MTKILPKIRLKSRFAFVINTGDSGTNGVHWQAVFGDARPNSSQSIEFFDSFGDKPDSQLQQGLKQISEKLNASEPLKMKINLVRQQAVSSPNCGPFSVRFILNRFRNMDFGEATGYNDHKLKSLVGKNEKEIESFKHEQLGLGSTFGFI